MTTPTNPERSSVMAAHDGAGTTARDRTGPSAGSSRRRDQRTARTRSHPARTVLEWLLFAIGIALLWPVQFGGITGITIVHGQSMEPTYSTGDVVLTLRLGDYRPGDVISYTVPDGQAGAGGHVIHRVESVQADGTYITIGDNNDAADQWVISDDDVTGRAIVAVPGLGLALSPQFLPYILAFSLGGIVTVLLWRSTDDSENPDETNTGGPEGDSPDAQTGDDQVGGAQTSGAQTGTAAEETGAQR